MYLDPRSSWSRKQTTGYEDMVVLKKGKEPTGRRWCRRLADPAKPGKICIVSIVRWTVSRERMLRPSLGSSLGLH